MHRLPKVQFCKIPTKIRRFLPPDARSFPAGVWINIRHVNLSSGVPVTAGALFFSSPLAKAALHPLDHTTGIYLLTGYTEVIHSGRNVRKIQA